ncbi:hypothetical protein ACFVWF_27875 [Rhodococcus qingshengii]|uniref:hypothetical protein n=1 Tax=Rhodococcus qingshengii TaxID=334542 RepID=UPI0036D998F7
MGLFKSEALRSVSGWATLGTASFVLVIPVFLAGFGTQMEGFDRLDDEAMTRVLFGVCASAAVVALFHGGYAVSRENYYCSTDRSLVIAGFRNLFVAKAVASAFSAVLLGVGALVVSAVVTAIIVLLNGGAVAVTSALAMTAAGALVACAVCAVIGVATGWIFGDYYTTMTVTFLLPLVVELPLLMIVPSVERFLPIGAVAGLANIPVAELFPWWVSGLILVGWMLAAVGTAVAIQRRRVS